MKALVLYILIFSSFLGLQAQEKKVQKDSVSMQVINTQRPAPIELNEVTLTDLGLTTKPKESSQAISILSKQKLDLVKPVTLATVINQVPGVFMQSGTFNTNRITIRGIGARSLFGTTNIRAYFGEIPLTDGNGESVIEDLELSSVSQIEIHKGPAASSFGVGLGGTIILQPLYTKSQKTLATLTTQIGSYNFQKLIGSVEISKNNKSINLIYSNNHSDGYRENNAYNRTTLTGVMKFDLGTKDEISLLTSYIHLNAQIPSSLSQEDFEKTPKKAAFTWGASKAFEHVNQGLLGITWKHNYTQKLTQHTSVFGSIKDNVEPRPFNILEEKTNGLGIRTKIQGTNELVQLPVNWMFGVEGFTDQYLSQTFENTYQTTPNSEGSSYGQQLSDFKEQRSYINIFGEALVHITPKIKLTTGLHTNYTFYNLINQFSTEAKEQLGNYDFDLILSPKLGLTYTISEKLTSYGSISHGFSMPTTAETLLPNGTFNQGLKPEIGWNFELGLRLKALQNKLLGELTIYTMYIEDLLVTRRNSQDDFFGINAGQTRHTGIEMALSYPVLSTNTTTVTAYTNATINQHRFVRFIDNEQDFSNNDLTGVPSEVINIGLDVVSEKSIYGMIAMQYVGKIPVNDGNTLYTKDYSLLNAQIGYKNNIFKRLEYDLFFNLNNSLDTKYASQIQVNAVGFGENAPRFFYPGMPINYYTGINIKYKL
ncbi:TonB-dependent receptor [Aquimarina sp. W85]|uniref:TonB-dependent receptor n=1 Tax=Aquimarina rhodophyticola TaxID=3342246 RepID=UPI00366D6627